MNHLRLLVLTLLALLASSALGSISLKPNKLGVGQVLSDNLAANIINSDKIQSHAVKTEHLVNEAVTSDKIGRLAVNERHIAYRSVTAKHLAIETVQVLLRAETPGSNPGGGSEPILGFFENRNLLKPKNVANGTRIVYHYVADSDFYEVTAAASGPGVILGWYPSLNGHLLRYQTDRAFNQMNFEIIQPLPCSGGTADSHSGDAGTDCQGRYVDYTGDIGRISVADNIDWYIRPVYVGDVRAAGDEYLGTPVYSPSVESLRMDDTGVITVKYAGRGLPYAQQPDIIISVVVLRNNGPMYQENPQQYDQEQFP